MMRTQTKQELLERVQQERTYWESIVAEVGEERMNVPGAMGEWTFKDTVAHLTTWWRRDVARLAAAQRGERPPDHPPQDEVAVINEWIYLTNRDRPLRDVLDDANAVWQQLEDGLNATSEQELFDAERFEWLDRRALGPSMVDDFVLHLHEEHAPLIREWLAQLEARNS
jgi:hypothetical protein